MPVRTIPLSRSSLTGFIPHGSATRVIAVESKLEYDFVTLMAFDPDVMEIEEQPVCIHYDDDDGNRRRYTPDFLVTRRSARPLLVEIKPSRFVDKEVKRKLKAGKRYASARGWLFQLWTEREIRVPRLKNAQFFSGYRETSCIPDIAEKILQTIRNGTPRPIRDIVTEFWPTDEERGAGLPALWHLIAIGRISCDMDHEIDMSSPIWVEEGPTDA